MKRDLRTGRAGCAGGGGCGSCGMTGRVCSDVCVGPCVVGVAIVFFEWLA